MARITVTVYKYGFKEPEIISEGEYKSYRQIFKVEPNFNLTPKVSFWNEFEFEKWVLIGLFGGIILGLIWEPLFFITALSILFLISSLSSGSLQSMFNYQKFLNEKNRYYNDLKNAIINSDNYNEFKQKMLNS